MSASETVTLDSLQAVAHKQSNELFGVLALIRAVSEIVGAKTGEPDSNGMTDSSSRAISLLAIADEKVRTTITALDPHI